MGQQAGLATGTDSALDVVSLGSAFGTAASSRLESPPLLAAVARAGERHVHADTADPETLRKDKLPDLASALTARLPIDTLSSLLADADFEKIQEEMDAIIDARLQL